MSFVTSIINTMTSSPIAIGSSFAITIMVIQAFQEYSIREKEIKIKEYYTTNPKIYSIVDQDNNCYLIDKDVFNRATTNIFGEQKIYQDVPFHIQYNNHTPVQNTHVITKMMPWLSSKNMRSPVVMPNGGVEQNVDNQNKHN